MREFEKWDKVTVKGYDGVFYFKEYCFKTGGTCEVMQNQGNKWYQMTTLEKYVTLVEKYTDVLARLNN